MCPCIQVCPAVPQGFCNMGDPLYSLGIAGGFWILTNVGLQVGANFDVRLPCLKIDDLRN